MPRRKQKTISFGVFGISLADRAGSSLGTFGKSESFKIVLPTGKTSKPIKFPKGLRSAEKKRFVQKVLYQILETQEARRQKARERYREARERAGKKYKPRVVEKPRVEKLIGTNKARLQEIQRELRPRAEVAPTTRRVEVTEAEREAEDFRQGRIRTISDAEWVERERLFFQWRKSQSAGLRVVFDLSISSTGTEIPVDKNGRKTSNWVEHQLLSGLVSERDGELVGEHSIWFQVTRYLREFKKIQWEAVGEAYGKSGTLAFKLCLVTNLGKHEDILSSYPTTDVEKGPETPSKTDLVTLDLSAENWKKEWTNFQHRVVSSLIRTLYQDPEDYLTNQEARLTSSETYFVVPLESQSGRGIKSVGTRVFKAAFSLILIPALSS